MNQPNAGCEPKRQVVAQEIMTRLEKLAAAAEATADRTASKLAPVCIADRPTSDCCDEKSLSPEYPPLFVDIRGKLETIERAISWINNVLDRCEL
jgi:hypothetical protein